MVVRESEKKNIAKIEIKPVSHKNCLALQASEQKTQLFP